LAGLTASLTIVVMYYDTYHDCDMEMVRRELIDAGALPPDLDPAFLDFLYQTFEDGRQRFHDSIDLQRCIDTLLDQ